MATTLSHHAIRNLVNSADCHYFGIPQAQARFLFASLNLELEQIVNGVNYDKDMYNVLVKKDDFWGNVVCKKLYENLDLVTKYYGWLLSSPKDYQYIIRYINFLYEMSCSNSMLPEVYYDFILNCREKDSKIETERLASYLNKKILKSCWKSYPTEVVY